MKEAPEAPGASAVQLYYSDFIDMSRQSESFYHRIKILSQAGMEYANVTIRLADRVKAEGLQARTIRPDGSVVPLTAAPFEKTIVKGRGITERALSFTFPDVAPGSIVEYRYSLRNTRESPEWILEQNLFTVKESFGLKYDESIVMSYVASPGVARLATAGKGKLGLELENVAAFQPEPQMPPEKNYKLNVAFSRQGLFGPHSSGLFWREFFRSLDLDTEQFIGNREEIRKTAQQLVGGYVNAEQKLRRLYSRAQEVRNLTYERERTEKELRQEDLKTNKNVVDVLKHGYGTREDINLLFVALARAAGFPASLVLTSSRREHFFRQDVLSSEQFDSSVAEVLLDGTAQYLAPGTRFCPYGLIHWTQTGTQGARLGPRIGFLRMPPGLQSQAVVNRTGSLEISRDGGLHGEIFVIFLGGEALERKLYGLETDAAGRRKTLEEEIRSWLPSDAEVRITDVQGWEQEDEPLRVSIAVDVPNYASIVGQRMLLPTSLFPWRQSDAFNHVERKYPVYFPYAFSEIDKITFKLPSGYSVEIPEPPQEARTAYASYRKSVEAAGNEINAQRSLLFNAIFIQPDAYPDLRGFFAKVVAGDDSRAVLRQSAAAEPQKSPLRREVLPLLAGSSMIR